ncbi:unnamed protein product [Fusarium graminearum]|uniref:Chromosome 4, complete genome n=1 Tax=Gibberella zeae (strain ATCC MYA-4620 / CBS 123657 / FGSC 9075 / NRRL 31084 / PH-1) TaxID=229533 RepID=A0A098DTQ1_GIBZE|nr:unnamed protein product [Fusarium graminearum]
MSSLLSPPLSAKTAARRSLTRTSSSLRCTLRRTMRSFGLRRSAGPTISSKSGIC